MPLPSHGEAGARSNANLAVSADSGVRVELRIEPQVLAHPMQHLPATPWLHTIPLPTLGEAGARFNTNPAVSANSRVCVEPSIDLLLTAPAHRAHPTALQWDLAEHPNNIKLGRAAGSALARDLSVEDLARCAVCAVVMRNSANGTVAHRASVMLACITLVFPGLPLTVECKPTNAPALWASPSLLSVGDVLYSLYAALRLSVSPQDFNGLTQPHQEAVSRAFWKRLASDLDNYDDNIRRGVRYVDYLGRMRKFAGLRPAARDEIPAGKRRGEVFVVVLTPSDTAC